jgi:hypothetical protein
MFIKSSENTEEEIIGGITQNLSVIRLKKFNDSRGWHNVFYNTITSKINEKRFEVLFSHGEGRPNTSVSILIAMMIMKEG